jgi:hypothetical protein
MGMISNHNRRPALITQEHDRANKHYKRTQDE